MLDISIATHFWSERGGDRRLAS